MKKINAIVHKYAQLLFVMTVCVLSVLILSTSATVAAPPDQKVGVGPFISPAPESFETATLYLDLEADARVILQTLTNLQANGQVGQIHLEAPDQIQVEARLDVLSDLARIPGVVKLVRVLSDTSQLETKRADTLQSLPGILALSGENPLFPLSGSLSILASGGAISGKVTAPGGSPLQGIYVTTSRYTGSYWSWSGYAYTDADGNYSIGGLNTGIYRVGFYGFSTYLGEYYDNAIDLDSATDISVTDGITTSGVNATLAPAGHITGQVTAEGGGPLADIQVTVYSYNGDVNSVRTDANGNYDVGGLNTGVYRIKFSVSSGLYIMEYYNNATDITTAADIAVTAGNTTANINAALAQGARITGRITSPDGTPLSNISVTAYQKVSDWWSQTGYSYTDINGDYAVGGSTSGIYRLQFQDFSGNYLGEYYDNKADIDTASDISATLSNTTSGINATLSLAGHITGQVTAPDGVTPLQNVSVTAYRHNGNGWVSVGWASINADGNYSIGGLKTDTYRIQFYDYSGTYLTEYFNNAAALDGAMNLSLTAGTTLSGVNASLALAGHITGRVTAADGSPIQGVGVTVYRYSNGSLSEAGSARGDASGNYNAGGLATGVYRVKFSAGGYAAEFYDNIATPAGATNIPVTAGATTPNMNAVLSRQGGTVTGRVTGPGGVPLKNIEVEFCVWVGGGCDFFPPGGGDELATDANGNYEIPVTSDGTYHLEFYDPAGVYRTEYYNDVTDVNNGQDLVVTGGITLANINAQLSLAGHVAGQVTNLSGSPLTNIYVTAYRYDASRWVWTASDNTDAGGNYDIGGLASGSYRVRFYNSSGAYAYEYYNDVTDVDNANDIAVTAGLTTSGVNASLASAGRISGRVTAAGGNPLQWVYSTVYRYQEGTWDYINSSSTDADGNYSVIGLTGGNYRVEFSGSNAYASEYYNNAGSLSSAADVPVTAGGTTTNIDAILEAASHITGQVTSPDGSPLANISATAYQYTDGQWEWASSGYTNSSGNYDIGSLSGGVYRVEFRDSWNGLYRLEYFNDMADLNSASDISLAAGATAPGKNAVLALVGSAIAPGNLTAAPVSSTQINLSWSDNNDNESGFKIERSLDGLTGWIQIDTVGANITTYANTGLTCRTTYYYRLRAYNAEGNSDYSNTANAITSACPPAAPGALTSQAISAGQINLAWIDYSTDEDGFKIERSPDGSTNWSEIATVPANTIAYSNTGLACHTPYYYRVRAYNSGGVSVPGNIANATTQYCASLQVNPPSLSFTVLVGNTASPPQSVTISNGGAGTLNWTASENTPWLSLSQIAGTAPASINVLVNNVGLGMRVYTGTILISSADASNSPQTIFVTLTVAPHQLYLPIISVPPPQITNLEVNQAIQSLSNAVPLITNRPALIRTYVNEGGNCHAKLYGFRNNVALSGSPILANNGPITLTGPSQRDNLNGTLNFNLPTHWASGSLQVYVELTSANGNTVFSRYPQSGYASLNFRGSTPLQVRFVPIVRNGISPNSQIYNLINRMLYKTYPLGQSPVIEVISAMTFNGDLRTDNGWYQLLDLVASRKQSEDRNGPWYYYGVINIGSNSKWGGMAYYSIRASVGQDSSASTGIHEIGHNHGRMHAPCGNPAGIDPAWPYATNPNAKIMDYGYDILDGILLPPNYIDFMSYCGDEWVTAYTYNGLKSVNQAGAVVQTERPRQPVSFISGVIAPSIPEIFPPIHQLEGVIDTPVPDSEYRLALYSMDGTLLYTHAFAPLMIASLGMNPDQETTQQGFHVAVPRFETLARIQLWHKATLLAERTTVGITPQFSDLTASVNLSSPEETLAFSWAEPSPGVFYRLYYSPSGQGEWILIADGLTGATFNLETRSLPGGLAWFKIAASDGLAETTQTFGPVTIPNKPPTVNILLPNPNLIYRAGRPIDLQGTAFDLEDGALAGRTGSWYLNQKQIATGFQAYLSDGLPIGEYTLILRVNDSQREEAETQVAIRVQ